MVEKVKIFFRISKLGFGGAEQVFLSLAREFSKRGGISICFVVDQIDSDNVKTAINEGHLVHSLNASRTMKSIVPLAKFIKQEQPDVIISAYTDTNAAAILSASLCGMSSRVIVSEHASLFEHWQNKSRLKKLILKSYVSYLYRLSTSVICVSKGLSGQVAQLMGSTRRVKTIYNPVRSFSVNTVEKQHANTTKQLIAVGRVAEPKDYSTLIRAVAKLNETSDYHLTIVGGIFSQSEFAKVTAVIEQLNIQDKVTFAGYTDKVEDYYREADIFVMSSAWEGFGNVIVEAMSLGLPVVSTDCNYGPAEILENGKYGRLVSVGDSEALAAAIFQETLHPLVSKDALIIRAKDFSEKKVSNQYFKVISEVINAANA
ncbi:glycosyltransferase [Vibrio hepatarius]|uniref:glycosyltransferase n=1 Tax=Vibrio hepatarius TaxID=171383 RepID=UPI00148C9E03|nr:glycosyltransferase [Vibrio hepatarius]